MAARWLVDSGFFNGVIGFWDYMASNRLIRWLIDNEMGNIWQSHATDRVATVIGIPRPRRSVVSVSSIASLFGNSLVHKAICMRIQGDKSCKCSTGVYNNHKNVTINKQFHYFITAYFK
jgi:hypothetical protein